jgi:hypothetical protein
MSIRRVPQKRQRAFRPACDLLEGRQLLSSAYLPQVSKGPGGTPTGPAIAAFNDKLYMAWVGHGEGTERIAISSSSNGGQRFDTLDFLPETSASTPALASFDGRL